MLLDLGGCLTESNDVHAQTWSEALLRFGMEKAAGEEVWLTADG